MEHRPLKTPNRHEEAYARRRDRQMRYNEQWENNARYYDNVERAAVRFEAWTSPRYYDDSQSKYQQMVKERDRLELLEKRRNKLRTLLAEEEQSNNIELTMHQCKELKIRSKIDDIPTEILQDINNDFKEKENMRRRHFAEQQLYRSWRDRQPEIRDALSSNRNKNLKIAWLDQQIEKRMDLEREREEAKKHAREHDAMLQKMEEKEREAERALDERKQSLSKTLKQQMEEYKIRATQLQSELKQKHQEEENLIKCQQFEHEWRLKQRERADRECALHNIRDSRRKLKEKALENKKQLRDERDFLYTLKQSECLNSLTNEIKKLEIQQRIDENIAQLEDWLDMEKQRQPNIEFVFDSEAKSMFDRFNDSWQIEQDKRQRLIKECLDSLHKQIAENAERLQKEADEALKLNEERLNDIERYNNEIQELEAGKKRKQEEYKRDIEEQMKENNIRRRREENTKKRLFDAEINRLRAEEERIKEEIRIIDKQSGRYCRKNHF